MAKAWRKTKDDMRFTFVSRLNRMKAKVTDIRRSLIVVDASQWATVPFQRQGQLSLNTDEMIDRRLKLRRNPELVHVLEVWWKTALHHQITESRNASYLTKEQYVLLSRKLYRAMVEEWDEEDAMAVAEEEWRKDSNESERMGKELFMDGIFEFADMYTLGVSVDEYSAFLWKLFCRIAKGNPPDQCIWKDDAEIMYRPIHGEPSPAIRSRLGKRKKLTKAKPFSSTRLLKPTASSRSRYAPSSPGNTGYPTTGSERQGSDSPPIQLKIPQQSGSKQEATRTGGSLAEAITLRSSNISNPSKGSLRNSMRRASLTLNIDALAVAAAAAAAVETSSMTKAPKAIVGGRRGSISNSVSAAMRQTLRVLNRPVLYPAKVTPMPAAKYVPW